MMRNGVARMSELINNVLDLTQARLGGGFQSKVGWGLCSNRLLRGSVSPGLIAQSKWSASQTNRSIVTAPALRNFFPILLG
jgi:hypothetical protein